MHCRILSEAKSGSGPICVFSLKCGCLCACVRACVRVCVCLWLCVWLCVAPEELQATMASSLRLPQEKSSFPLTASQEVGCVALAGARD